MKACILVTIHSFNRCCYILSCIFRFYVFYFLSVFISYHRSSLFANKCLDFCFQTLSRQKILLNFKIILDNSNNLVYYTTIAFGLVAQLVRAPPCHGGGRRFESDLGRCIRFLIHTKWGLSSAGRASALQAEGHRFEPCRPHFYFAI